MKIITRNSPPETRPSRRRSGFTLIELLLVLVILGVLAAIVVPKFAGRTEQAREAAAKTQLSTFGTVLDAFEVENGYYDLATPFYATEYTMRHLGLPAALAGNVTFKYYDAGHMMYVHAPDLGQLKASIAAFIDKATGK